MPFSLFNLSHMHTLICGSLAFDSIMVFEDRFRNHILPEKLQILNVCFLVPEMRREFGGTAGNIAYNLRLLNGSPMIMATVGHDFASYDAWLQQLNISRQHIRHIADSYTAQAFITTDLDDNQITAFHPGAMQQAHQNSVTDADDISLAVIAPDGREGMLLHARECAEAGIPILFDPGQGLPMFTSAELLDFIAKADYLAVNDYEAQLLQEKTQLNLDTIAGKLKALIVTQGAQGSVIYADGQRIQIPCVKADRILDPTGCGDAYRAGLLYGIAHNWSWAQSGRLAAVMGAIKIASRGGQNHQPSLADITARYEAAFGEKISLYQH